MPSSKSRHPHKHPHHTGKAVVPHQKPATAHRLTIIATVFFALLGLAISFFTNYSNPSGLIIGTAVGALAGLLMGITITKSISKK